MSPSDTRQSMWVPNTDVIVTESVLIILVELAGMWKGDLEVTAEDSRLLIQGSRGHPYLTDHATNNTHLVKEINVGNFETVIDLPQGYDLDIAKAQYQHGFLLIEVPQRRRAGES